MPLEPQTYIDLDKEESVPHILNTQNINSKIELKRNKDGSIIAYINNIMFLDIKKKRTYPKLREYLFSLNNYTFRIYSIADGYRIVCMNKKLTPDCDELIPIINNTNAKLLRVGNTEHFFTIRLTPKPKRAGCNNMPNLYPRTSNAEQQLFVDWLNEYDNKLQNYSVCQYIETLDDTDNIDLEILSFIEYHDQITKCFTELPLEPSRSIFNKNEG